jgi:hypothetical protein
MEQLVHFQIESIGDARQQVEGRSSLAGFDATDRLRLHIDPFGQLSLRESNGPALYSDFLS